MATYDLQPEMSAFEIRDKIIPEIKKGDVDFICLNFANPDMVGHTGNFEATVQTMETIDQCTQQIVNTILKEKGIAIILADHGNADEMFTLKNGVKEIKTAHSLNKVPFAILDSRNNTSYTSSKIQNAGLANVASTICNLLGYTEPQDYQPSLIK